MVARETVETLRSRWPTLALPASLPSLLLAAACVTSGNAADWRNIANGLVIPGEGYADQPYAVKSVDGSNHWLVVVTTGPGNEGDSEQHIVATVSTNQGASWSMPVDIEPSSGPEASWGVPYMTPYGRVYVFYTFNKHRLEPGGSPVTAARQDTLGAYCFRYSDDFGATWSDRYEIPYRQTAVDLNNTCPGVAPGQVNMFWGVSKALERAGNVVIPFSKVGTHLLRNTEGWMLVSTNLMTETDAAALHWDMRPSGETGIRNEAFGSIQEEHVAVTLSSGEIYDVFRTTTGYPAYATSADGGLTWTTPAQVRYADGARRLKNPRANCKVWKAVNGKYLLWYHNNSTTSFNNRNPAWVAGGIETNGTIVWSEPEILLFDLDSSKRLSYPDLIEYDGRYWITETQKTVARVHEVDATLLAGLWAQGTNSTVATNGLRINLDLQSASTNQAPIPVLESLADDGGFALDFWVRFNDLTAGQIVADSRNGADRGFVLRTASGNKLELNLSDGSRTQTWDTDYGALAAGRWQHVAVIVDGSPNIITFVVNGRVLDGGSERHFGWTRFDNAMADVNGAATLSIAPTLDGELGQFRLYDRHLRTSEAVGNFSAWTPPATTWPTVADTFHFDGTYEPDSATPPPGNDTWTVFVNGGLEIVPNSPIQGHAAVDDHLDGNRMAMHITYADAGFQAAPANYEWSYSFRMSLERKPLDDSDLMLFGVRGEGMGNGKAVMLAFDTAGRLGLANANGSGFQLYDLGGTGINYDDETIHTFRVEKRDNGREMEVRTYVDGDLVESVPYASFQDDLSTEGFGIWSSSPGTGHVIVDDIRFGPGPWGSPEWGTVMFGR